MILSGSLEHIAHLGDAFLSKACMLMGLDPSTREHTQLKRRDFTRIAQRLIECHTALDPAQSAPELTLSGPVYRDL